MPLMTAVRSVGSLPKLLACAVVVRRNVNEIVYISAFIYIAYHIARKNASVKNDINCEKWSF